MNASVSPKSDDVVHELIAVDSNGNPIESGEMYVHRRGQWEHIERRPDTGGVRVKIPKPLVEKCDDIATQIGNKSGYKPPLQFVVNALVQLGTELPDAAHRVQRALVQALSGGVDAEKPSS